jgi:hypothetical protein
MILDSHSRTHGIESWKRWIEEKKEGRRFIYSNSYIEFLSFVN